MTSSVRIADTEVSIIIPCFNETESIGVLYQSIEKNKRSTTICGTLSLAISDVIHRSLAIFLQNQSLNKKSFIMIVKQEKIVFSAAMVRKKLKVLIKGIN